MAYFHGVRGPESAWKNEGEIKFLCPSPGYDRHFTVCQNLGIKMITIPFNDKGPDMDKAEEAVKNDPLIKGIWCVPKFSNPTGHIYSDETVRRMAALPKMAGDNFRIMWDNAYAVHDLREDVPELANIMDFCKKEGTQDNIIISASTAKITFAGAGIGFIGTSPENISFYKKNYLSATTIGHDKINQLRHARFFKDLTGIKAHMKKHAELVKPKFEIVQKILRENLAGKDMGNWTDPQGGYFLSFDSHPGLAKKIVKLAAEVGVKLTPAGATFPYKLDPENKNIRIAPTYPKLEELKKAMEVFVICVQLASVQQKLGHE